MIELFASPFGLAASCEEQEVLCLQHTDPWDLQCCSRDSQEVGSRGQGQIDEPYLILYEVWEKTSPRLGLEGHLLY